MMENEKNAQFSDRELEVLACLIIGEKSYKATGKILNISPKTVETHLRRTLIRCGCDTKSELVKYLDLKELESRYYSLIGIVANINIKQSTKHPKLWKKLTCACIAAVVIIGCYNIFHEEKAFGSNVHLLNKSMLVIRKDLIQKIENIFDKQNQIRFVIISGVGGSGKSTLARCFIKEHSSNITWEVNAETEQELEYSFFKLAENIVKFTGIDKNLKKIKETSNVKLRREKLISFIAENLKNINNWILLFDNVKDIKTVQEYLPTHNEIWGNGFVVITTRNAKLSDCSPFSPEYHLKISELTLEEQLDLFKLIHMDDKSIVDKKESLKTFLQNIPLLPLDTAIAAYYVKNTGIILNDYIHYLQEFSYDFQKVQAQIAINHIDYDKTRFGIIASDFNEIIGSNQEFKELLFFTCLMNPQYISIKYLKQLKESVIVDNFIYELQKYSLIYINENIVNMHRFIQQTGLYYIVTEFSEKELIVSLEKLVKVMAIGNDGVSKLSLEECLHLSRNIESLLLKINLFKLNREKKQQFNTQLSNTLLYCYIHFKPREFIKDFSKQIINDNRRAHVLSQEDLAVLLETCGNACLFLSCPHIIGPVKNS